MSRAILGVGVLALLVSVSAFAADPAIESKPLGCVSKGQGARIIAHFAGQADSMRVYFHSVGSTCGEYYVDMHKNPANPSEFWAILPEVAEGATAVSYQVKAQGAGGKEIVTQAVSAPVDGKCVADALSPDETKAAKNLTLGLTSPQQAQVPCSFKCNGVMSVLVNHQILPNDACRAALAQQKWYETPTGEAIIGTAAV